MNGVSASSSIVSSALRVLRRFGAFRVGWCPFVVCFSLGFSERDKFGLLGLFGLDLGLARRCSLIGTRRSRGHRNDREQRAAFGASDRALVQVVVLRAATGAEAFGTKLGLRHRGQP